MSNCYLKDIERCYPLVANWPSSLPDDRMNPRYTLAKMERCNSECYCRKYKKFKRHKMTCSAMWWDDDGKMYYKNKKHVSLV